MREILNLILEYLALDEFSTFQSQKFYDPKNQKSSIKEISFHQYSLETELGLVKQGLSSKYNI